MPVRKSVTMLMLLTVIQNGVAVRTAEAGPLIDWLFGTRPQPVYAVGSPVPVAGGVLPATGAAAIPTYGTGYAPYSAGYSPYAIPAYTAPLPYSAGYAPSIPTAPAATWSPNSASYTSGYSRYGVYYNSAASVVPPVAGNTSAVAPLATNAPATVTLPPASIYPTPVTLVPDYRTTSSRTPVTYYRPVLTTDPTTGAQVVTLTPCTSYEYQAQRVPTWGLTQLYAGGATLPPTMAVPPTVSPTLSLPRGGVPLAGPASSGQPYTTAYGSTLPSVTTQIAPVQPSIGSVLSPATPYSGGYPTYASNYGNYSALQPPIAGSMQGTYPTSPYNGGLSPYYNSNPSGSPLSGGSSGTFVPQSPSINPGNTYSNSPYGNSSSSTVVPPSSNLPPYSQPTYPNTQPSYPIAPTYPITPGAPSAIPGAIPGSSLPAAPPLPGAGSVSPPGYPTLPSTDPAAGQQPIIPLPGQSNARLESKPQLQSVVQQPMVGLRPMAAATAPANSTSPNTTAPRTELRSSTPEEPRGSSLLPVPIPNDFKHEPRWNPGLLNDQDQTAANSRVDQAAYQEVARQIGNANPQIAYGGKTIQWASWQQPASTESDSLQLTDGRTYLRDSRDEQATVKNAIEQPALRSMKAPIGEQPMDAVPMVPIEYAVGPAPEMPRASSNELMLGESASPASAANASSSKDASSANRYPVGQWITSPARK